MRTFIQVEKNSTNTEQLLKDFEEYLDGIIDKYSISNETATIAIADGYGFKRSVTRNINGVTSLIKKYKLSDEAFHDLTKKLIKKYQSNGINLTFNNEDVGYGKHSYVLRFNCDKFRER